MKLAKLLIIVSMLLLFLILTPSSKAGLTTLFNFTASGTEPRSAPILIGNVLYGTTQWGGSGGSGTIYTINTNGMGYNTLYTFQDTPDGGEPYTNLTRSGNVLYGTTDVGGFNDDGTIFSIDANGLNYTVLYNFTGGSDGSNPESSLIISNNVIYGTTFIGGTNNGGAIFSIDTNGNSFTVLHDFTGTSGDGSNPEGSLVLSNNVLYGTTGTGGIGGFSGVGTIYSIATNGLNYNIIHSFTGDPDGADPDGGLVSANNVLYGTTYYGGVDNAGTAFSIATSGASYNVIYSFTGGNDGSNPYSSLTLISNVLYGTAYNGGADFSGTLFSINTNGANFNTIYSFTDGNDGANPYGGVIFSNNVLYGAAFAGGTQSDGTLFSIATNGLNFNTLHIFTSEPYGANPYYGNLTLSGNVLYGMTQSGGAAGDGAIFSINTNGLNYNIIYSFTGTNDGGEPYGGLTLSNNVLYGMTNFYGADFSGTIFSIDTNGFGFNTLYTFTGGTDGANPFGSLTLSNNVLYGMTNAGGTDFSGTIFSMDANSANFNTIYTFTGGNDGANPYGSLTLSNNILYGMTSQGGADGSGTVFSINTNGGNFNTIYTFTGGNDGGGPYGSLTLSNNVLYGLTNFGGTNFQGTIFSMDANGANFNALYSFGGGPDGSTPFGSFLLSNGILYGMTESGGVSGKGTIFSIAINGSSYNVLYNFTGQSDGGHPYGSLILSNNIFYATTSVGTVPDPGADYGTIFKFINTPTLVATPNPYDFTNNTIELGQITIANTVISHGASPYTGNWFWFMANDPSGNTVTANLPISNNALMLTINAFSSNELILTYNGVHYDVFTTGSNTIYGVWTFNAFAGDANGDGSPVPSLTNTLLITSGMSTTTSSSTTTVSTSTIPTTTTISNGGGGGGGGYPCSPYPACAETSSTAQTSSTTSITSIATTSIASTTIRQGCGGIANCVPCIGCTTVNATSTTSKTTTSTIATTTLPTTTTIKYGICPYVSGISSIANLFDQIFLIIVNFIARTPNPTHPIVAPCAVSSLCPCPSSTSTTTIISTSTIKRTTSTTIISTTTIQQGCKGIANCVPCIGCTSISTSASTTSTVCPTGSVCLPSSTSTSASSTSISQTTSTVCPTNTACKKSTTSTSIASTSTTSIATTSFSTTSTATSTTTSTTSSSTTTSTISPTAPVIANPITNTTPLDQREEGLITDAGASGGTPPYNYQWLINVTGPQSNYSVSNASRICGTGLTCNFTTNDITGIGVYHFRVEVTDSLDHNAISNQANILLNPHLVTIPIPTVVNSPIIEGEHVIIAIDTLPNPLNGTAPYSYQWLVSYNGSQIYTPATSIQCSVPYGSGNAIPGENLTCTSTKYTPTGVYNYKMEIIDSSDPQNSISLNSTQAQINNPSNTPSITSTSTTTTTASTLAATTIISNQTGGGGGGGNGGGNNGNGGGGGGSGSSRPIITKTGSCIVVSNVAVPNTFNFTLANYQFNVTDNYIATNYTSVIVNGETYVLNLGVPAPIGDYPIRMELTNVSYLPISHTVTIITCPTWIAIPTTTIHSNANTSTTINTTVTTTITLFEIISTTSTTVKLAIIAILVIVFLLLLPLFFLWRRKKKEEKDKNQ